MEDKTFLLEAIDNYDLYAGSAKTVLKTLIEISIDNVAIVSVKNLTLLSKVSRPMVYKALDALQEDNIIERMIHGTSKKSSFTIKSGKLSEIEERHRLHLTKEKNAL